VPQVSIAVGITRFDHVTPVIAEVRVVDDPEAWRSAGFMVNSESAVVVGRTTIRLAAEDEARATRRGITGWTLAGATEPTGASGATTDATVDGLPTSIVAFPEDGPTGAEPGAHPNGVVRLDHVVVLTPDLDRTTEALQAVGLAARRTREAGAGPDGVPRLQRFFRVGEAILEVVGPATPTGDGCARFWGLAYVVDDLDATAAMLGERMSRPRDAVQPGRRIAALRPGAGLAVPTAFLTASHHTAATG
jgi:hypothetical protein